MHAYLSWGYCPRHVTHLCTACCAFQITLPCFCTSDGSERRKKHRACRDTPAFGYIVTSASPAVPAQVISLSCSVRSVRNNTTTAGEHSWSKTMTSPQDHRVVPEPAYKVSTAEDTGTRRGTNSPIFFDAYPLADVRTDVTTPWHRSRFLYVRHAGTLFDACRASLVTRYL